VTTPGARTPVRPEWMSIREACALIGVSPATLRRWSDAGNIRAFTTPGGHRRFSRAAVSGLLPTARHGRPNLERLGATPARMARAYRRDLAHAAEWASWVGQLNEEDREPLREHGRLIAASLLGLFDAATPGARESSFASAEAASAECGRIAASRGVDMRGTIEAFLRYRMPFLRELAGFARRGGLDTTDTTDLLEEATAAFDRLLGAAMDGHASGLVSGSATATVTVTADRPRPGVAEPAEGCSIPSDAVH
jgi:excisionase family DNA binding protein